MASMVRRVIHNRYRVDALLGMGGMGRVYRAWDINLNIPVALKEMVPDPQAGQEKLAKLRQQFKHEAQIVASLDHFNLVRVTNYFSDSQSEYLVMNFVQGESLADRIQRQGAHSEAEVLLWAKQLLDGLSYCHARNVIHRDIKPQNVIITEEGRPILVDFGLVKLWDPQNPRTQTVIRAMGTLHYAPPEQYGVFSAHTDPRSDLYSLGALLYHALTGKVPLSATDRIARPDRFIHPRAIRPRVSSQTEAAILRAMELSINNRFSAASEMAEALHPKAHRVRKTMKMKDEPHSGKVRLAAPLLWGLGGGLLIILLIAILTGLGSSLFKAEREEVGSREISTIRPTQQFATSTIMDVAIDVATATSLPAIEPSPTPDVIEVSRVVVKDFQEARRIAYKTWNTEAYQNVLIGDALDSSLAVIQQLRNGDCYYDVTDEAEMQFRYEEVSEMRVVVIASRLETQQRKCGSSVEYVCQAFDGRYVVEKIDTEWYIIEKSVQNYTTVTPCPP